MLVEAIGGFLILIAIVLLGAWISNQMPGQKVTGTYSYSKNKKGISLASHYIDSTNAMLGLALLDTRLKKRVAFYWTNANSAEINKIITQCQIHAKLFGKLKREKSGEISVICKNFKKLSKDCTAELLYEGQGRVFIFPAEKLQRALANKKNIYNIFPRIEDTGNARHEETCDLVLRGLKVNLQQVQSFLKKLHGKNFELAKVTS